MPFTFKQFFTQLDEEFNMSQELTQARKKFAERFKRAPSSAEMATIRKSLQQKMIDHRRKQSAEPAKDEKDDWVSDVTGSEKS